MPNPGSDEPLTKITINVYTKDLKELKRRWGQGWSTGLRGLIRDYLETGEIKRKANEHNK